MSLDPRDPKIQAVFLRGHMQLLAAGMRNSRMTAQQLLGRCSAITGKTYRKGEYQAAIRDLTQIIEGETGA